MADPAFPRDEGTKPPGEGGRRQHTILPKFPKNCMKLKEFGPGGVPHAPLDPPLICDSQWRIKDSPEEDTNSWICGQNILWQDFSRKLHEGEGGVPSSPHDPLTEWCTHLLTSFSHLVGHTFFLRRKQFQSDKLLKVCLREYFSKNILNGIK